jgi:hypothetical protein
MASEQQQALLDFSKDVAGAILMYLDLYPDIYSSLIYLSSVENSPSVESELMEIRSVAGDIGETMTIFSRTIEVSAESYAQLAIDAANHPLPMRGLIQDIAESCMLIARSPSLQELVSLPLIDPETLSERASKPQLVAWITFNQPPLQEQQWRSEETDDQQQQDVLPEGWAAVAADPAYAPPPSPYPATDPSDQAEPATAAYDDTEFIPEPAAPVVEPNQWSTPDIPGHVPGDRSRGSS